MAAVDDPKTLGSGRVSFASETEIDQFVAVLEQFECGDIGPDEWRAYRLVRGTYGQRQTGDVQMVRVKVPQGVLDASQMAALADVGEQYSRGFGHITTRQNVQFHFVKLHDVEPAMRRLAEAGLTTREACGNSVRNITGCPFAGVGTDELFDVTPYADALTRYLLRHPLSSSLPRKFKIGFEGCATDHVATAINDLGFRARVVGQNGSTVRGFRVTVGGGTAILCVSGHLLYEFLPAGDILDVAEAIVRVFHRLGDRVHKQRNRMKFLMKAIGWDRWRAEFDLALAGVRREGGARLPFDAEHPPVEMAPPRRMRPEAPSVTSIAARIAASRVQGPGIVPESRPHLPMMGREFSEWSRTNVHPQKQPGYSAVAITTPLGDITSDQLRVVGELALAYGDGTVRTTLEQDLVLRWVPTRDVADLYRRLAAAGLGLAGAGTIADVTSCPGAESCRLAVTQSRGLGRDLEEHLRATPELANAAADANIKISGCPNGCGQHHIAAIGFQGSIRRLGSQVLPQYFVMVGGKVDDTGASFGRLVAKIPARKCREAVNRLVALYQSERIDGENATDFFARAESARVRALLIDLERLTAADLVPADFIDLGETGQFTPEIQQGECAV